MIQKTKEKLLEEANQLLLFGKKVLSTERQEMFELTYDDESAYRWKTNGLNFLGRVFGESSHYYTEFCGVFASFGSSNAENLRRAQGVLLSAKDSLESGSLVSYRSLVQAEIFSELLEQAEHLQQNGYSLAAAVITGAVLEDGLRKICDLKGIELSQRATLEPLNVALAKAGVYSGLVQKQITALTDLRNKAAHGKSDDFTGNDVEIMVKQVRDLLTRYLI